MRFYLFMCFNFFISGMKKTEKQIQHEIHIGLTESNMFRNNVGTAKTSTGSVVKFGLCPGSSDLIGWTEIEITPEMVGKRMAIFTGLEVKTATGRASEKQKKFIERVIRAGGISGIVRSLEDARRLIKNWIQQKK